MVDFYDYTDVSNSSIRTFLNIPSTAYPYFWAWILGGIWVIITLTLYFKGREKYGKENVLSCMSISSFAVLPLALIGTILGMVSVEIMIYTLVLTLVINVIWFFSD